MRELPLTHASGVALNVELKAGIDAALDEAAANAPPSHAFLRAAWYSASGGGDAATLTARRPDGRLLAAIPTIDSGRWRGRTVPGCYWPCRSVPVASDATDEELAALLAHPTTKKALGRVWRLGPFNEDDPCAGRLATLAGAAGWSALKRPVGSAFILDIAALRTEGAWPRGSTLRKNRFFEKHLAADGPLEFRFVTGSDWTAEVFDTLAAIEAKSWVGSGTDASDAKFLAPHHRRFWEAAAADPLIARMMWGSILSVGGVPAAFGFDLDCGATRYCIANSYDPRFAKQSPGRVLAYRSFEHLDARGITLLDWGSGDSGYKRMMGAAAGPEIVDYLFVRGPALASLLRPLWSR